MIFNMLLLVSIIELFPCNLNRLILDNKGSNNMITKDSKKQYRDTRKRTARLGNPNSDIVPVCVFVHANGLCGLFIERTCAVGVIKQLLKDHFIFHIVRLYSFVFTNDRSPSPSSFAGQSNPTAGSMERPPGTPPMAHDPARPFNTVV